MVHQLNLASSSQERFFLPPIPWTQRYGRVLWGFTGFVGLLLLWQIGILSGFLDPVFVSSPSAVLVAGIKMVHSGDFLTNLATTSKSIFVGLGVAFIIGVTVGLIIGWFPTIHALLEPVITGLYAMPYVAFLPMIIMWTGIGNTSRTIIVIWSAIFPLIINTIQGVREIDKGYLRVARSFAASRRQMFITVALPGSLPYILAGLRLSVGRALVGAIVAEFFMSSSGLGYFINLQSNNLQMGAAFAAIFLVSLLGVIMVSIVGYAEKRFGSWR